jgi:hypothetical protein
MAPRRNDGDDDRAAQEIAAGTNHGAGCYACKKAEACGRHSGGGRQATMKRYGRVLALSLSILPTIAAAAEEGHLGTPQQQRACRPDVLRLCKGISEDLAIANCLQANIKKLTPACRKVFEGDSR